MLRQTFRVTFCLLVLLSAQVAVSNPAGGYDAAAEERILHLVRTANDLLPLVRKHWAMAQDGDVEAMVIVFNALNNCATFETAIRDARSIDDLQKLLSDRHPLDVVFAKGIFFKCKALVQRFAEFPGWRSLRLRAALAGDVPSKIWMAISWYGSSDRPPRESLGFSPGGFVVAALDARHPMMFDMIGRRGVQSGMLRDSAPSAGLAWQLASCALRGNYCHEAESMAPSCDFMSEDCVAAKSRYELLRLQTDDDELFRAAVLRSEEILQHTLERRYEELGLVLVW